MNHANEVISQRLLYLLEAGRPQLITMLLRHEALRRLHDVLLDDEEPDRQAHHTDRQPNPMTS